MADNARLGASVERLSQKYRKLNQAMRLFNRRLLVLQFVDG
jgi:hypothetical protein